MLTIPLRETPIPRKQKNFGNHEEYLSRITKSLYYVKLPTTDCTSLPVTELAAEIFSETKKYSLDHLDVEDAANLSHNACVSPCSLVLALLYLDRLKSSNPKYLAKVSPSELFLISLMIGSKFLQDDGEEDEVNNYEWAISAGLTVQDVNRAEKQFLNAIKWEVYVSKEEFWNRLRLLECRVGLRQGCKRGWFTYSELCLLLEWIDFATVVQALWTVTTACLTSYTASVLALIGSALIVGQIPGLSLKSKLSTGDISQCQDWNTTSPWSIFTYNKDLIENDAPKDCYLLSSIEKLNDSEAIDSEVNFWRSNNYQNKQILDSSERPNIYHILTSRLSQTDLINVAHDLVNNLKGSGNIKLYDEHFSTWGWTDVIKNYFVRDSVPTLLFPIRSF